MSAASVPRVAPACAAVALAIGAAACDSPVSPTPATPAPTTTYMSGVVYDGDTAQFAPSIGGSSSVRLVNIDAPEMNGRTQEPWATRSRAHLRELLPHATSIAIVTDRVQFDSFGRVLGQVVRVDDALNANREQVRMGHAVTYFIWPNVSRFEDFRQAQVEAQEQGRGIWNPGNVLSELPFEYRLRTDRRSPERPVGDYYTRYYVEPAEYRRVHVNNRLFFQTRSDAGSAGYRPCPRDSAAAYSGLCFGPPG